MKTLLPTKALGPTRVTAEAVAVFISSGTILVAAATWAWTTGDWRERQLVILREHLQYREAGDFDPVHYARLVHTLLRQPLPSSWVLTCYALVVAALMLAVVGAWLLRRSRRRPRECPGFSALDAAVAAFIGSGTMIVVSTTWAWTVGDLRQRQLVILRQHLKYLETGDAVHVHHAQLINTLMRQSLSSSLVLTCYPLVVVALMLAVIGAWLLSWSRRMPGEHLAPSALDHS